MTLLLELQQTLVTVADILAARIEGASVRDTSHVLAVGIVSEVGRTVGTGGANEFAVGIADGGVVAHGVSR